MIARHGQTHHVANRSAHMCGPVEVGVWFRGTVHTNLDAGLAGERATWGQTQHFKKTVHTLTGCSPYKWKCMEPKQRAHSARCSAHTHTHTHQGAPVVIGVGETEDRVATTLTRDTSMPNLYATAWATLVYRPWPNSQPPDRQTDGGTQQQTTDAVRRQKPQ